MLNRIVIGLGGLAILLPSIIFGGEIAVEIIVFLAMCIGLDEYANMAFPDKRWWATGVLAVPGIALFATVLYGPSGSVMAAMVLGSLFLFLAVLFKKGEVADLSNVTARLFMGVIYVSGLLVFLPLVRRLDDGLAWIFTTMAITWLGDTGAYFAGRAFGKTKLYEKISPKKTWEGAVGGAVLATIGVFVIRAVALPQLTILDCILLGVVVDAFGVVGDLVESMFKRSFGVKDSGWILGGHGGILDRIDALLFTAPVLYVYLTVFRGL
ncbi:MAG: phosphatidate cytidylyltransferase [Proteobacteria bacterium]|nr:phosphatidate cytidylyltransferase [Pseudomonadota bacterium]